MRLKLAVKGDLVRSMKAEEGRIARAVTKAIDDVSASAQAEIREQVEAAFAGRSGRRLAKTVRRKRYPPQGPSIGAAALIYSRASGIIAGSDSGAVILPRQGRFLAIPTNFNRNLGRRGTRAERAAGGWAGVRVTPEEMVKSGLAFVRPRGDGPGLVWFLKVKIEGRKVYKSGVRRGERYGGKAIAGGLVRVGDARRRARDFDIIEKNGGVPMFVLVPQVRVPKKLSLARVRSKAERRLPREIRHNLETMPLGEE